MEYFERLSTVVVHMNPGPLASLVDAAARGQKIKVWCVEHTTDLIAVGCILAIVDPARVGVHDWNDLCGWYEEMDDVEMKVLLTEPAKHKRSLPSKNLLKRPRSIDQTYLRLLFVRQRSTLARRREIFEKKERQIVRLMYMLAQLDQKRVLNVREVAKEFQVAPRAVQRDLDVLLMAGYPVEHGDHPGSYMFPEAYMSYMQYY